MGTDTGMGTGMTEPGGPSKCGPPCDVTWTHIGDLIISPFEVDNADVFACMTRVVGTIDIFGFDQHELAGLRNLVSVEGGLLISGGGLTDLSAFECLEEVTNTLGISDADNLLVPSGMSRLRFGHTVSLSRTGATVMPSFAPDFTLTNNIEVSSNPALTNLDAIAAWKSTGATAVYIDDNPSLTSVEGLQSVLLSAESISVSLYQLPALASLDGLNGATDFVSLFLMSLPLVEDLSPLAQLEHVDNLTLNDMPKVTDLQGLNQLESVDDFRIGGCWSSPLIGMTGLQSLDGLSSLTTVGTLAIAWNSSLTTLTGADKLTAVTERWTAQFNALDEDDLAAFAAQVNQEPCNELADETCSCFSQ